MPDPFGDFVARPGAETFLTLRRGIIGSPDFDMASNGLSRLEALVAAGDHGAVPALVPDLMPTWLLNARVHVLLGQSAAARGETGRAASEARLAEACLFGLRATGDGTAAAPFRALLPADEYDLAQFLGRQVQGQRREDRSGQAFDVLTCTDGSEIWFDITDGVVAMAMRAAAEV